MGVKSRGEGFIALQTFHETAQLLAPARMAQLAQRLGFNLPDTFASHLKILTDFFKGVVSGFADAEPFRSGP